MTPSEIIAEVRRLINDTRDIPYRYSDTMLLGYVNQVLKRMVMLRPDIFGFIDDITTVAGTAVQSMPANSHRLIDIFQVKGSTVVTEADRESLSRNMPTWMSEEPGTPVNFMRHPRNPNKYFLYPPPSAGVVLVGEFVKVPDDYTLEEEIEDISLSYMPAIIDGVIFLASSVDDEHVEGGRAKLFLDSFTQALGVSMQNRAITDSKNAGLKPSAPAASLGEVV